MVIIDFFLLEYYNKQHGEDIMSIKKEELIKFSLEEVLSYKSGCASYNEFLSILKHYLENRISLKLALSDTEIELLNKEVSKMINCENKPVANKNSICEMAIRLIVMSKNMENTELVDKITRRNLCYSKLSKENIYTYFITAITYAPECLNNGRCGEIIHALGDDIETLEKIREFVVNGRIKNYIDKVIGRIKLYDKLDEIFEKDNNVKKYTLPEKQVPSFRHKRIITIDDAASPDLDGAFSVEKCDDLYYFNIYISDVPSVLLLNEDLIEPAYKKGLSMYNHRNTRNPIQLDMLPRVLSHEMLSLKEGKPSHVITFSYCVDEKGKTELINVSRNVIFVNNNVVPEAAKKLSVDSNKTRDCLIKYKELCSLISKKSDNKYLLNLHTNEQINDLIAVPSILVNCQVGKDSKLAIYRSHGKYAKTSEDKYTHSATPIRRFVSDINLTMYLSQLGLINCPDKYIYYLEDNMDSIIEHLNEKAEYSLYFEDSYKVIDKYLKTRKKQKVVK